MMLAVALASAALSSPGGADGAAPFSCGGARRTVESAAHLVSHGTFPGLGNPAKDAACRNDEMNSKYTDALPVLYLYRACEVIPAVILLRIVGGLPTMSSSQPRAHEGLAESDAARPTGISSSSLSSDEPWKGEATHSTPLINVKLDG